MELPSDDSLRWIVRTYARLRADHGNAIGSPILVHPTGAFFPDEYKGDGASVSRLLRRIMAYAPIADDLDVELAFVAAEKDPGGGCGSVACGTGGGLGVRARAIEELDDGYRVFVAADDVASPELLAASLARSVGAIVLCEGAGAAGADADHAMRAEVAAVACGFGVLMANGAAVWAKACGGLRLGCGTAMTVEEAAVALALFAGVHGIVHADARAHLPPTQREALDVAFAWTDSNALLLEALRYRPAVLATGIFEIEPARGVFGRWLRKRQLDREMRVKPAAAVRPAPTAAQMRRLEEARALVDEVMGGE